MKRSIFFVLVVILVLSMVGCQSPNANETTVPEDGVGSEVSGEESETSSEGEESTGQIRRDTLTIAEANEPQTLDPYAHSNQVGFIITGLVYENLIKVNEDGEYIPWLATEWEQLDDTTFLFKLRDDVYFHDGTQFTAEDVAYTLKLAAESSFTTNLFGSIDTEGFVIVNDFEIEVHLKTLNAAFLPALAQTMRGMVSKNYYETASEEDIARKPMGTGPMVFNEWIVGDRVTMKINENYWGEPVAFDNFVARFITEASSREIEVETGGVDIAFDISPTDYDRLRENPDTVLIEGNTQGVQFLTFNSEIEPFDDINVRLALAYALDLPALIQVAWENQATVADSYYASSILGHIAVGPHEHNIEKAKEHLALAGYEDGFSFTFTTYQKALNLAFSEAAKAMWAEAGIDCTIEVLDLALFTTMNNEGQIGVSLMTTNAVIRDPSAALLVWPTARTISIRHNDTHVDDLLNEGLATYDEEARIQIYGELQEYLWSKLYTYPIAFPMGAYATTSSITNLPWYPNLSPDLTTVQFLSGD